MDSLILDLAIILIFGVFLFLGFKNGIMRSFFSFVSAVFSGLLSVYFSKPLASWVYFNAIAPAIRKRAMDLIQNDLVTSENFLVHLPKFIVRYIESNGITSSFLDHIMNNNAQKNVPEKISEAFAPVVTDALKSVFVVILFITFMALSGIVVKFILNLFKSSLMKKTNTILGGIFGLLKGYVSITIALCCLKSVLCISQNVPYIFSEEIISNTAVFKGMYNNNPIYEFFKLV